MQCLYAKYGCTHKIANSDHQDLHISHCAHIHLELVTSCLEKEIEKNRSLLATSQQTDAVVARVAKLEDLCAKLIGKIADYEAKYQELSGI